MAQSMTVVNVANVDNYSDIEDRPAGLYSVPYLGAALRITSRDATGTRGLALAPHGSSEGRTRTIRSGAPLLARNIGNTRIRTRVRS